MDAKRGKVVALLTRTLSLLPVPGMSAGWEDHFATKLESVMHLRYDEKLYARRFKGAVGLLKGKQAGVALSELGGSIRSGRMTPELVCNILDDVDIAKPKPKSSSTSKATTTTTTSSATTATTKTPAATTTTTTTTTSTHTSTTSSTTTGSDAVQSAPTPAPAAVQVSSAPVRLSAEKVAREEGSKADTGLKSDYYFFKSTDAANAERYRPKQLAGEDQASTAAVEANKSKGLSAWNTANTWEEHDVKVWAHNELTRLVAGAEGQGSVSVRVEVSKVVGDADVMFIRGKKRCIYELTVEGTWQCPAEGEGAQAGPGGKFRFCVDSTEDHDEQEVDVEVASEVASGQLKEFRAVVKGAIKPQLSQFRDLALRAH